NRHLQRERPAAAVESLFQRDAYPRMHVFAAGLKAAAASPATGLSPGAEQRFKKITEPGGVCLGKITAMKFLPRVAPVRRWREVLARLPLVAEIVIGLA